MAKFRKKPVEIEAVQFLDTPMSIMEALNFLEAEVPKNQFSLAVKMVSSNGGLKINTLEGSMKASFGDWIIRGVSGEYYPCKPDIFEKTYDAVKEKGKDTPLPGQLSLSILTEHRMDPFETEKPYVFSRDLMALSESGAPYVNSEWAIRAHDHLVLDFSPNKMVGYIRLEDEMVAVFSEWCTEAASYNKEEDTWIIDQSR